MSMADRPIRIGNGAGFWGDNLDAPFLLARDGRLDVLTLEYLAELTMAILAHLRSKDPRPGYVGDFPELLERLAPILNEQAGPTIVTNAGGLNPSACAARCGAILAGAGLGGLPIGVVTGDDVLGRIPGWIARRASTSPTWRPGEPIATVADRLVSANVYLGARPIAEALAAGARIVVTGRVADASLTLGPAARPVRLGLGRLGPARRGQRRRPRDRVRRPGHGRPLARLGRAPRPRRRRLPDRRGRRRRLVRHHQARRHRRARHASAPSPSSSSTRSTTRRATGRPTSTSTSTSIRARAGRAGPRRRARGDGAGRRRTGSSSSAVYRDGWTASGLLAVVGREAEAKARAAGRIVLERVRRAGFELADSLVECLGAGDVVPGRRRAVRPAVRGRPAGHRPRPEPRGRRAVLPRVRPARHLRPAGHRRLRHRAGRRPGRPSATGRPSCRAIS